MKLYSQGPIYYRIYHEEIQNYVREGVLNRIMDIWQYCGVWKRGTKCGVKRGGGGTEKGEMIKLYSAESSLTELNPV